MNIEIIGCVKPNRWYAGLIGSIYEDCIPEKACRDIFANEKAYGTTGRMIIPELKCYVWPGDYKVL